MGILDAPVIPKDSTGRRLDGVDLTLPIASAPTVPAGLDWPSAYDLGTIALTDLPGLPYLLGSATLTPEAAFDAVSTARTSPGATYYVDGLNGLDANAGTSVAPFRSIGKAVASANTGGVPTKIIVKATVTYYRGNNPTYNSGAGGQRPTVDIAFLASGGRILTGTFDSFSTPGAVDATYTNCYTLAVAAATVNRVHDIQTLNRDGNHSELVKVADAALCNVTPGSWVHVSGTLYIHRADGAAPSVSNTRYYRSESTCFQITSNAVNVYIGGESGNDGFDCEGGSANGVLDAGVTSGATADKVLAVSNCSFRYGGGAIDNAAGRGVSVDSWRGLAIFSNVRADANLTDGFNAHNSQGAARVCMVTINCSATDNGRPGQQSCNGHTLHEDVKGIDIAGRYERNRGGTIRNINTSKALYIGTMVRDDLGDRGLSSTGTAIPTAVRMDDTAEAWFDRARVIMPAGANAYTTGGAGSIIHKRDCWPTAQPDAGVGTYAAY